MKWTILLALILAVVPLMSQSVGIGTNSPHASAALDISSNNQGFLPPRVSLNSLASHSPIATTPEIGLMVYNTNNAIGTGQGYYFWSGAGWKKIATLTQNLQAENGITYDSVNHSMSWGGLIDQNVSQVVDGAKVKYLLNGNATFGLQGGGAPTQVALLIDSSGDLKTGVSAGNATLMVDASTNRTGILTNTPEYALDVNGTIAMRTGAQQGYVLISGADGEMIWSDPDLLDVQEINDVTTGIGLSEIVVGNSVNINLNVGNGIRLDNGSNRIELGGSLTDDVTTSIDENEMRYYLSGNGAYNIWGVDPLLTSTNIAFTAKGNGDVRMDFSPYTSPQHTTFYLESDDNQIGINTSSPTRALDVNGKIRMRDGSCLGCVIQGDLNGVMNWVDLSSIETGDVSEVVAGQGLSGGATVGSATLAVNAGEGVYVHNDSLKLGGHIRSNVYWQNHKKMNLRIRGNGTFSISPDHSPTAYVVFKSNGDADLGEVYSDFSTARVGIGTNVPSEKLDVVGNIQATGTIYAHDKVKMPGNLNMNQTTVDKYIFSAPQTVITKNVTVDNDQKILVMAFMSGVHDDAENIYYVVKKNGVIVAEVMEVEHDDTSCSDCDDFTESFMWGVPAGDPGTHTFTVEVWTNDSSGYIRSCSLALLTF